MRRTKPQREKRFPHTRGDGPWAEVQTKLNDEFSPHAWGWTVGRGPDQVERRVFPTRVGMDRIAGGSLRWEPGFPHTRGDGPQVFRTQQPGR